MTSTNQIHVPADWENSQAHDLLQIEAGQAYVQSQIDQHFRYPQPEYKFYWNDSDSTSYRVYSDGSLWFVNNAGDEVWCDYRDFVTDRLLPGLTVNTGDMRWTQEEADEIEQGYTINEMDRGILLLYSNGDEEEARKLLGM